MGVMKGLPSEEQEALAYAVGVLEAQIARLSLADADTPLVSKEAEMSDNMKLILAYRKIMKKLLKQLVNKFEGFDTLDSTGLEFKNIQMQMDEQDVEEFLKERMAGEQEVVVE